MRQLFPTRWAGIFATALLAACALPEQGGMNAVANAKAGKMTLSAKKLIGLSVAEASERAGLAFKEYWVVEEPPGIGRAVQGFAPDGSKIRLYVNRIEAPTRFDDRPWDRKKFASLIVQGVAREKGGKWSKDGVTMLTQPGR